MDGGGEAGGKEGGEELRGVVVKLFYLGAVIFDFVV